MSDKLMLNYVSFIKGLFKICFPTKKRFRDKFYCPPCINP